jgi:unsaturated chondroitin disaccharide hydrolase
LALYQLTGEEQHRETGLRAAEVLAGRFIPDGNYIQAWGHLDGTEPHFEGLAIIDCMMNLPLLYWAANETGDSNFREIAVRHADTTLKNFIRSDGSVYHAFRFDPKSGAPLGGDNYCGHSVESHWARGMAWAIYGFALSHRYTGEARYLEVSLRLARNFMDQLDDEIVPVWDFKLPAGAPVVRDSSAAAVVVCAFQELIALGVNDPQIASTSDLLLSRLCDDHYLNREDNCPGVLKDGQVGFTGNEGINAYSSWGDYYLTEALSRKSGVNETFW